MNVNLSKNATCDLCHEDCPDTSLVVMLAVNDDNDKAPVVLDHVECIGCHSKHADHLDDGLDFGPDLCGTLREFRDGTLPLNWWKWVYYYAMREVEDGDNRWHYASFLELGDDDG